MTRDWVLTDSFGDLDKTNIAHIWDIAEQQLRKGLNNIKPDSIQSTGEEAETQRYGREDCSEEILGDLRDLKLSWATVKCLIVGFEKDSEWEILKEHVSLDLIKCSVLHFNASHISLNGWNDSKASDF